MARRKKKHYIGQNKQRSMFGRDINTFRWVVPRMLRRHYARKHTEYLVRVSMKIRNNSMYGALPLD